MQSNEVRLFGTAARVQLAQHMKTPSSLLLCFISFDLLSPVHALPRWWPTSGPSLAPPTPAMACASERAVCAVSALSSGLKWSCAHPSRPIRRLAGGYAHLEEEGPRAPAGAGVQRSAALEPGRLEPPAAAAGARMPPSPHLVAGLGSLWRLEPAWRKWRPASAGHAMT